MTTPVSQRQQPSAPSLIRLPLAQLDEVLTGDTGAAALDTLGRGQRSKHLIVLHGVVRLAEAVGHRQAPLARAAYRELARLQQVDPARCAEVLYHPAVRCWAARAVRALFDGGTPAAGADGPRTAGAADDPARVHELPAAPGELATVAVAAALRCGQPPAVAVPAAPILHLPTLGRLRTPVEPGTMLHIRAHGGGVEISTGARRGWLPVATGSTARTDRGAGCHRGDRATEDGWAWAPTPRADSIHRGLRLRLRLDPLTLVAPDDPIAATPVRRWRRLVTGAWTLLIDHGHPAAHQVSAVLSTLVPLPTPPDGGAVATTYRDGYGAVALTVPGTATDLALALVHEVRHAQLAALSDLLPLVTDEADGLYYAPWRTDPRPLIGLLHGIYAHTAVAGFWRREYRIRPQARSGRAALAEYVRWRDACVDVVRQLAQDRDLTPLGRHLVARLGATLDAWCADPVPARVSRRATRVRAGHRKRWLAHPDSEAPTGRGPIPPGPQPRPRPKPQPQPKAQPEPRPGAAGSDRPSPAPAGAHPGSGTDGAPAPRRRSTAM